MLLFNDLPINFSLGTATGTLIVEALLPSWKLCQDAMDCVVSLENRVSMIDARVGPYV